MKRIGLKDFSIGSGLIFILGPCVIESEGATLSTLEALKRVTADLGVPFIFKSSYDKANRTSVSSFRGPGMKEGLRILKKAKEAFGVPVLTDIHCKDEVASVAEVADIIQIPAFLCRQTDLIVEAARTGRIINIKKGQFMAPQDMLNSVRKAGSAGNESVFLTERGSSFGYNNLVVDFRSIPIMRGFGCPVVFDATHSVQAPGGMGSCSGGDRAMARVLARAAAAVGVDGFFLEVHPDPDKALCDGPNSIALKDLPSILKEIIDIDGVVKAVTPLF
ncbi:MAG TPA: 3-deoxy-8-phosphooctulonate synthase [Deltaproteobacteria bacterium]|nr:MAG: 3-deoxy-8-phosphooctulonate synthase [Deltaproteobacteria bacterium GWA2_55_82]OGQ63774.1 MAG: 3-deoxy-8-phosphooctulonate synthase [Deltaproteobacteria bacterium RIFCSPLOWO2_02_FULL_55_12]OIJ73366.1 MAG: 3-deoxy-8-phosphooctulonate synthase [Deltaproteobacteria bacterium GWC2_55_46]HBG45358.1 3-deoxy-8-phosphooctulonate synthase [Deltaproteobacteria bacterium]HCY10189.1 3-deoxy-8-phosphooctulonate synthase [Deltaproteobacteria bacterium]